MRVARFIGARRRTTPTGVTVVIASWNTKAILEVTLRAVREHSPPDTEIIVVDNHSTDGSRAWLSTRPYGVRPVLLPFNIHHGRALDLGFVLARTPFVVTLDSDAFPYEPEWIDLLTGPIARGGAAGAGMWGRRDRLHPACAAYRRDAYFRCGLSFSPFWSDRFFTDTERRYGENIWDTGELISLALTSEGVVILPTKSLDYGGWSMANVAYHHGALSRLTELNDPTKALTREAAWDMAVADLLGGSKGSRPPES